MVVRIGHAPLAPLPEALHARWRKIPVSVAVDLAPDRQISPEIRSLRPKGQQPLLCARAVTVRCEPPDFGAVLKSISLVGPGQVLVIDAGGHSANAMIGDVLGGHLHGRGASGIVCDGAIRDAGNLAGFESFSVFCRHVNPRGPVGAKAGAVNEAVTIGGVVVNVGDLILGDDDGLIALPVDRLSGLIDAAEAKIKREEEWTAKLKQGVSVDEVFGLD